MAFGNNNGFEQFMRQRMGLQTPYADGSGGPSPGLAVRPNDQVMLMAAMLAALQRSAQQSGRFGSGAPGELPTGLFGGGNFTPR